MQALFIGQTYIDVTFLADEIPTGDEKTVVDAFAQARAKLGEVDVAVACAGILGHGGPVFETSVDDFENVMGVNVRGAFLVVREAAKGMRLDSPRGPVTIDPDTRDIVQNVYMRKVEKVDGELYNVEFQTYEAVKDPAH